MLCVWFTLQFQITKRPLYRFWTRIILAIRISIKWMLPLKCKCSQRRPSRALNYSMIRILFWIYSTALVLIKEHTALERDKNCTTTMKHPILSGEFEVRTREMFNIYIRIEKNCRCNIFRSVPLGLWSLQFTNSPRISSVYLKTESINPLLLNPFCS